VTTGHTAGADYRDAADVRSGYAGLLAGGCDAVHRRWWSGR
jgi:hypothetical protein